MCKDSVSHQAREYQVLLGDVIDWQLHTDNNSSPLSRERHALGKNRNGKMIFTSLQRTPGSRSSPRPMTSSVRSVEYQSKKGPPRTNSKALMSVLTVARSWLGQTILQGASFCHAEG